jgi:signal peptidase I
VDHYSPELIPDFDASSKPLNVRRLLLDLLETVLLTVVVLWVITNLTLRIKVESISMRNTLKPNDYVVVNRWAYKLGGSPQRGDIIVFKYPPDPTQIPYIKRVIGLPGDNIRISGGRVYINGVILTEPYIKVSTNPDGEWTVPAESLFVMGDNRQNSSDSRAWGMVPFANILGKAEVIYWPPQDWAQLHFPSAAAAEP